MKATNAAEDILRIVGPAGYEPSREDWSELESLLAAHYKDGLFTILMVDRPRELVRRSYSNNPEAYPTGGTKQLMGTPWARHVIHEGRSFIASTPEQMQLAFADHRLIADLGCTTALNVPLRRGNEDVAWTVNLLRGDPVYTPSESLTVQSKIKAWIGTLSAG